MAHLRHAVLLMCLASTTGLAQTPRVQTPTAPSTPAPPPAPVRLSGAMPVYPDDARQRKVGGVVTLDVALDARGKVVDVKMARSIPALQAAAAAAVRQWTYRPVPVNGSPAPSKVTAVFYFDAATGRVDEVRRIPAQGPQPKRTKRVDPTYPPNIRSRQTGRVVIDAVVDRAGKVIDTRVRGAAGGFDTAALDAVRQWEYEPLVVAGTAVPFVITVTVLLSPR